MAGLLDYLDRFYANDGLAGLLGMKSAGKQMEENNAKVESLAEEGQGPMLNREQFAAMLDNPMVFALGTGNVGKVTPQMLSKLPMDEASRMARAKAMGFDTSQTLYHGTGSKVPRFDPERMTKTENGTSATFMTKDPTLADAYAGQQSMAKHGPINDGTIGEVNREIFKPLEQILGDEGFIGSSRLQSDMMKKSSEGYSRKEISEMLKSRGVDSQKIEQVMSLRDKARGLEHGATMGAGANVMPLVANHGRQMTVDMLGGFNPHLWDAILDQAKKKGFDSVLFKGVVDSPSGAGAPADVVAILDPKNIRSRFAAFDPAKKDSSDLLASIGLLGMIGGGAALTNGEEQY